MSKVVCIYHNADPDGIFSGAIVLNNHPDAVMIGYNYEAEVQHIIDECAGALVYMVDISFDDWGKMQELCDVSEKFIWIDHHITAFEKYRNTSLVVNSKFHCHFSNENLGACIGVWKYFYSSLVPLCINLVAQYDTWQSYGSDYWNTYILPFRYASGMMKDPKEALETYYNFRYPMCEDVAHIELKKGRAIAQYIESQNEILAHSKLCFNASFVSFTKGIYHVLVVNMSLMGDMFKSRDMSGYDFTVGFMYNKSEGWKISLRSTGKDIDLGEIAKQYGGGGHKNAAGFKVATYQELKQILPYLK